MDTVPAIITAIILIGIVILFAVIKSLNKSEEVPADNGTYNEEEDTAALKREFEGNNLQKWLDERKK